VDVEEKAISVVENSVVALTFVIAGDYVNGGSWVDCRLNFQTEEINGSLGALNDVTHCDLPFHVATPGEEEAVKASQHHRHSSPQNVVFQWWVKWYWYPESYW